MEQQMKVIVDALNEIMRQTLADRDEIERLREALRLERQLKDDALRALNEARAALQQKESE